MKELQKELEYYLLRQHVNLKLLARINKQLLTIHYNIDGLYDQIKDFYKVK